MITTLHNIHKLSSTCLKYIGNGIFLNLFFQVDYFVEDLNKIRFTISESYLYHCRVVRNAKFGFALCSSKILAYYKKLIV